MHTLKNTNIKTYLHTKPPLPPITSSQILARICLFMTFQSDHSNTYSKLIRRTTTSTRCSVFDLNYTHLSTQITVISIHNCSLLSIFVHLAIFTSAASQAGLVSISRPTFYMAHYRRKFGNTKQQSDVCWSRLSHIQ